MKFLMNLYNLVINCLISFLKKTQTLGAYHMWKNVVLDTELSKKFV